MRSCFSCCVSEGKIHRKSLKKSIQEYKKAQRFTSFGNLSIRSDKSKIRYISNEIEKLGNGNVTTEVFTYRELSIATENFHYKNLIGEGGFGRVYKGHIERKNIDVAVKQLDRNGFQGNQEFLVEVLVLSLLHHPNLVNLVGYCAEGNHRILVYEYLPYGSLEDHLLKICIDQEPLDWKTRMKIALGAAKGLEYLHEQVNPPVIYRDFKASNILLDEDFNPKLSDFGLAKLGPIGDEPNVSTQVMGTYGYCAPEYASTGQLSKKSDVYSFGVVFLEIITGRKVIDISRPSEEQNLLAWAEPFFKDKKKFHMIADPLLNGDYPEKAFHQALGVAAMCLQEKANIRPFMNDVVIILEYMSTDKIQAKDDVNNISGGGGDDDYDGDGEDDGDDNDDDGDDDDDNDNDNDEDGVNDHDDKLVDDDDGHDCGDEHNNDDDRDDIDDVPLTITQGSIHQVQYGFVKIDGGNYTQCNVLDVIMSRPNGDK